MGRGAAALKSLTGSFTDAYPTVYTRADRALAFGIDCPECIEWKHWQAGGEYTRTFVVKNVSKKSQRLKYKLPATKYFSMEFPETINLSPGMSQTVTITFRPVRIEQYDDYIEFVSVPHGSLGTVGGANSMTQKKSASSFFIPVRAKLPVVSLNMPPSIEFGYCAVKEKVAKTFVLTNNGDLECSYNWRVDEPFALEPPSGVLEPGESQTVTVSFNPMEVSVYVANAVCLVAKNGYSVGCSIKGVGKFPFVTLSKTDVDFGDAIVGKSCLQSVRLFNHSLVPATFSTEWILKTNAAATAASAGSRAFSISPKQGVLTPGSSLDFKITYNPSTTGTFSSETVAISTKGGNTVALNILGNAIGPDVSLNVSSINFGNVKLGEGVGRVLYLENGSEIGIKFSLLAELAGKVFSFDKTKGEVEPYSSTFINVKFTPNTPSNYFKRIVCLVSNRAPLFVDMLGTGFNEKRHPPPLQALHVDAYYERIKLGLPIIPRNTQTEDEQERTMRQRLIETKSNRALLEQQAQEQQEGAGSSIGNEGVGTKPAGGGVDFVTELESWDRVFRGVDPAKAVVLEGGELDFGSCSRLKLPEYKTMTVRNNTRAKITCFWATPLANANMDGSSSNGEGGGGDGGESVFHVFPEESDVAPGGTTSFRVSFRPGRDRTYYNCALECFAYVKTMRNFRLVNDMSKVCAPWNLTATAWGHTYGASDEEFMPKASFSSRRIQFSGCHKGERTFLTTSLVNHGDTPVMFEFLADSLREASNGGGTASGAFELRPRCGVIGARDFSIIAMSFAPNEAREYVENFRCSLNNGKSNIDLQVVGVGYVPEVAVLPTSSISFKPTCLGSMTRRRVSLHNRSAIPIVYDWDLGGSDGVRSGHHQKKTSSASQVFKVEPMSGTIRGNETVDVDWYFMPNKTKHYHGRAQCYFKPVNCINSRPNGSTETTVSSVDVRLHGEGTVGVVTFDPPTLEFGPIAVGLSSKKQLTMYNHSSGNVNYQLQVRDATSDETVAGTLVASDSESKVLSKSATDFIKVDQMSGMIPARSSKTINIDILPDFSRDLSYTLAMTTFEQTLHQSEIASRISMTRKCPSVKVTAKAQYSMLCITNAFSNSLAKSYLWRQLRLDSLNKALRQPLSDAELQLNICNIATPILSGNSEESDKTAGSGASSGGNHGDVTEAVLHLGANLVGSTTTVTLLEFTNTSDVSLDWQFILQNDQEVEMENWVDVPEPQSDYEAAQNFIAENKIFEVSPKIVKMEPGAKCTVEMRYKHDFVGFHEMPMLLKVERGKRIRLRLQGSTRDLHERSVQLLDLKQTLSPVRIGETHPPSQALLLRNDGPTPVQFSFDTSALDELKSENYNFDILKMLNPSGWIAPGMNSHVNLIFRPLEKTSYSVRLPLTIKDGPTYPVELICTGYDDEEYEHDDDDDAGKRTKSMRSVLDLAGFSPSQSLTIPNSFATLSHDHVDFGSAVPTHATVRRCILLTNVLDTHSLRYQWYTDAFSSELVHGGMKVEPREGRIEPQGSVLVKLTYRASAIAAQMDTDITCRVMPEVGEEQAAYDEAEDLDDDINVNAFNARNSSNVEANNKSSRVYRKSLENRKSVVDAGTISMRNKFPRIYGGDERVDSAAAASAMITSAMALKRGNGPLVNDMFADVTDIGNNENIDSMNSNGIMYADAGLMDESAKNIIIGQNNSNNENVLVDDSDDRTMTMTLNLGISGLTVHQSSLSHEAVSRYFIPLDSAQDSRGESTETDGNAGETAGRTLGQIDSVASREMTDIIFEAMQDIILDCIGDADVREALGGAGGTDRAMATTSSSIGGPAIEVPPPTKSLQPKPAKPYAPYYAQIKVPSKHSSTAASSTSQRNDSSNGVTVEKQAVDERRRDDSIIKSDDFRSFASFVLDNAIFGILQESAADRWNET